MSNLLNALKTQQAKTVYTENGDIAFSTAGNGLLNYVATIGKMRLSSERQILETFYQAFAFDKLVALKLLFYTRDIPNRGGGGLGERRIFYTIFKDLVKKHPNTALLLATFIPEYGSWRDVRELARMLFHANNHEFAKDLLEYQFWSILDQKNVLAAKWAVDENERDKPFKTFALDIVKNMYSMTRKQYRKALVATRSNVVEYLMSHQAWDEINYSQVPSRAMKLYRKAFLKHDTERFHNFVERAKDGKVKINSGVLNPVELYERLKTYDNTIEAQWRQLPNFVDENSSALVVADVSGSMNGKPIDVCISLAMYFAERCKGPFANHFVTFSSRPDLVEVRGATLLEKSKNLSRANWDMGTDLEAAFVMILDAAIKANLEEVHMPKALIIITDGQFNASNVGYNLSTHERVVKQYEKAGYRIPHIVYWNVRDSNPTYPALSDKYVTLVSGYSASVLKSVFTCINNPNLNVVDAILKTGRYDALDVVKHTLV